VSGYEITLAPDRFDLEAIRAFLSRSYWAEGIPRETVRKAVANSLCVAVFSGCEQVGFARLVTDYATFTYLADVYVLEAQRGHGLSRQLVAALLVTRDAQGLYEKFGFTALAHPARVMELHRPGIYAKP